MSDAISARRVTRDVVFLAQNLRLLKQGGELAVILPEGLAVNRTFHELRTALIERHGLHRVVELPSCLFHGTEARTVAMFLRKGQRSEQVCLETSGGRHVKVSSAVASQRLDARFHLQGLAAGVILNDFQPVIHRGALRVRSVHQFFIQPPSKTFLEDVFAWGRCLTFLNGG